MDTLLKFILPGFLLLLTLIFGFWLSHTGKPYNGFLFNIHKLLALGTVVVMIYQLSKTQDFSDSRTLLIALLIIIALCVIALFASGALLSMGKLSYTLILSIHRIALVILAVAIPLVIYLLVKKV